jgi:hypothetical protein
MPEGKESHIQNSNHPKLSLDQEREAIENKLQLIVEDDQHQHLRPSTASRHVFLANFMRL